MANEENNNTRVRINFSLTAKGKVQWDITSEWATEYVKTPKTDPVLE